jgi:DNA invertase Pin-like site-specific DNA recombinase
VGRRTLPLTTWTGDSNDGRRLRLVGYVRVSTDQQAEKGLGLEIQQRGIRRWASEHGHRLVGIERDEGISGTTEVADRPGLAIALQAVEAGSADGLVVYRLDRLARSLTVQEAALSQVWRHGGRAFTVDGGEVPADDPEDPMRTFVRQVMGAASQLERAMIRARMESGRALKAEHGGYAGYGSPPFGWRAEGKALVPNEQEQAVIARARELHGGGASLREIARRLNAEGVPAKRGGHWHCRTVGRVLNRRPDDPQAVCSGPPIGPAGGRDPPGDHRPLFGSVTMCRWLRLCGEGFAQQRRSAQQRLGLHN